LKHWPLLALLSLPAMLPAQDSVVVRPGARVRLTTGAGRFVGTWEGSAHDSLTILDARRTTVRVVAFDAVSALEISRGRRRRTGRGALIGFVSGTTAGLVTALVFCRNGCGEFNTFIPVALGGAGAVVGTGVGALIGSQIRTERWESVPVGALRIGLIPQRSRRLGVGIQFAWLRRR